MTLHILANPNHPGPLKSCGPILTLFFLACSQVLESVRETSLGGWVFDGIVGWDVAKVSQSQSSKSRCVAPTFRILFHLSMSPTQSSFHPSNQTISEPIFQLCRNEACEWKAERMPRPAFRSCQIHWWFCSQSEHFQSIVSHKKQVWRIILGSAGIGELQLPMRDFLRRLLLSSV